LHPNKLSSIRDIRENIQKIANWQEYNGPEILEKIINSDLIISEDLKTYDANHTKFMYKFYPLPLNPAMLKKKKGPKCDEAALYQRKDGVGLHNAMSVVFHPFLTGYENHKTDGHQPMQIWYKALMLPQLLNYFEKTCYLKDINHEWFS
jgi:hypothetical protein